MLELSVVIPVMNEEDNIAPMIESVNKALSGISYELIFVDDGSDDNTIQNILAISKKYKFIRLIEFTRNFGQTSAMAAGINAAEGEYVATLDGDLQNDPSDIPEMLNKLKKENLDIVAGIRAKRKDGMFLRKIPSKIANILIRYFTKVKITDYGCTLKVFRAELAKRLDLYGELHRFIPILAVIEGAKIAEIPVKHHPRIHGQAKYGIGRTLRVFSDLMLMFYFVKYRQKPMHLFGGLGTLMFIIGGLIESYMLALKIVGQDIGDRPLFYVGILLIITGVQLITTGFIAELLMRTFYVAQNKTPYNIKKKFRGGKIE